MFVNSDKQQLFNVVFQVGHPLSVEEGEDEEAEGEEGESKEESAMDDEAAAKDTGSKPNNDENQAKQGAYEKAIKKKEAEDAKKEMEFSDLVARFDMEKDDKKDTQAFVVLQAGWDSSIGEVTIYGKITQDFGTLQIYSIVLYRFSLISNQRLRASREHCTMSPLPRSRVSLREPTVFRLARRILTLKRIRSA